jgi:hypothetical protein
LIFLVHACLFPRAVACSQNVDLVLLSTLSILCFDYSLYNMNNANNGNHNGGPNGRSIDLFADGVFYRVIFAHDNLAAVYWIALDFLRNHAAETGAMNLADNDPRLHDRSRQFILLGRNFCAMWGPGALPLDIRRAWHLSEDTLGVPRTVFLDVTINILRLIRRVPQGSICDRPNAGSGNGGGGPPPDAGAAAAV